MNGHRKGELGMKWLVFSDSHGKLDYMRKAVELEKPERILHLGDVSRDAERLQTMFPTIPVEMVRGNCAPRPKRKSRSLPPRRRSCPSGVGRSFCATATSTM